jgi:hypothetical protein
LTWKIADLLRNNNGKWLMVVNLEKSFSMKNCPMVKKILKILYTCLKKDFYYIFLFIKVSVNLSKKNNFKARKHPQKQVKNRLGCFHLHPLPGFYTESTGGLLTLGRIFSPFIILKSPPVKICSEHTER